VMNLVQLSARKYHGEVVRVSWDVAIALNNLGAEHLLLISQEADEAEMLQSVVTGFLAHRQLPLYAAHVLVSLGNDAATQLAVAVVPQVRYYRDAAEVGRRWGTVNYEALASLLGLSR